ncbi:TrkA C-terminal domain protein [Gleimia coleocanis DSM 15436]|uniref:TrkA C-terminal domain protein n=1 Tax=Gleimia coleocanis DSM 15436 TaxID=525245 RepID=C0W136_9ACTO|nr:TrkA C-terminal domain-containing protein [Gleimia coleocanis]EEH63525.1 TrkA C-terminal domain protein [Gleimia coleocanis DSM 15436]
MTTVFHFLADQPILTLFLVLGVGMAFGHVKLKGVSLGAAAVLFFAIGLSAWAQAYEIEVRIPHELGILGLAIFAFAIGITSGPSFFHNLKTALGPIFAMLTLYVVAAGAAYGVGKYVFKMPIALIAGTFAGATTNTPALHAAQHASGDPGTATVGYAVAYLFGVIGMLIASLAALAYGKYDTDKPSEVSNRTIRVERTDSPTVASLYELADKKVTFSRLRRGETGPIFTPAMEDTLDKDDLITIVGPHEKITVLANELGHASTHSLIADRRFLDFRRITVSDPKIAGRTIESLDLDIKFNATVSRVRRGDIDLVAEPTTVLQQGDRVRVVAPTHTMKEVTKFFGDSARGLTDINPIAMGLGMTLGVLLGELPILTPTGEYFSIGSAAGTLIVGLIFGKIGRIGKLVTTIPSSAAAVLAEFGLLVFLAMAGTTAGGQIAEAFTGGKWVQILLLGMLVTTIMATGLYVTMRWVFKMGGTKTAGILGGAQTQPAVLAFANARTGADPRVALGYALVYPAAMIGKILVAQILGGL